VKPARTVSSCHVRHLALYQCVPCTGPCPTNSKPLVWGRRRCHQSRIVCACTQTVSALNCGLDEHVINLCLIAVLSLLLPVVFASFCTNLQLCCVGTNATSSASVTIHSSPIQQTYRLRPLAQSDSWRRLVISGAERLEHSVSHVSHAVAQ